jgi:hypothetical protein
MLCHLPLRETEDRRTLAPVAAAQELKQLRDENARLKRLVADLSLDKDALQFVIRKNRIQLVGTKAQLMQARADVQAIARRIE